MIRSNNIRNSLIAALAVMGYLFLVGAWKQGSVIARSTSFQGAVVEVREVPSNAPWWALPFAFLPQESPTYRCELYRRGSNVIFSSLTIYTYSYNKFRNVTIEWRDGEEAVVYFESSALLSCDAKGAWSFL